MTLLPRPLLLLIWLRLRSSGRRLQAMAKTPKGLAVLLVGGIVIALMALPMIVSAFLRPPIPPETAAAMHATRERLLPFGILGFLLLSIVRASGDGALAFLQAEVDFLFPAPFTRAQLLVYKLAQRVVPLFFVSLFVSLWGRQLGSSWPAAWLGLLLALWLIHLVSLTLALLGQTFEARRFAWWRRAAGLGAIAALVGAVVWTGQAIDSGKPLDALETFAQSATGQAIAWPLRPYAATILAPDLVAALGPASIALLVNAALAVLAIRLDAHWLEASAESSQRLATRIAEVRRTGTTSPMPTLTGVRLPAPPRLGGIGPLLWRQGTTALRQGLRGLWVIGIVVGVLVLPPLLSSESSGLSVALRPLGGVILFYLSLLLPQVLRLDFRGDVDRMDVLKSLPLSATTVCLAQLLAPALVITGLQVPIALLLDRTLQWNLPSLPLWFPALFLVNLVISSLENVAFLLWPQRPGKGAGVQFSVAQVIAQMLKMITLIAVVAAAGGAGAASFFLLGRTIPAAVPGATIVLALAAAAGVAAVARLFSLFDPATEQPGDA